MRPTLKPRDPRGARRSRQPRRARLLRIPAIQALLLQAAAIPATVFVLYVLTALRVPVTLGAVAAAQGALAALFTARLGMARWWCAIQLLFPAALMAAHALALPPYLYLAAFLLLMGLYWSTYRTQVPLYPSGPAVWQAVVRELPPPETGRQPRLIDVGSGMGGMALHLARARPDCAVTGIELAPLPWLYALLRARATGNRARFVRGDYEKLDFGAYDLVFAYLSPAAMPGLWAKASAEMRPGSLLMSYEFEIAACPPVKTIVTTENGPSLYVWRF